MTTLAILTLAFALSADAFVAALGRTAGGGRIGLGAALGTGAVFGAIEAITPLIGWAVGLVASQSVAAIDHWIAFLLLALVGGRMVLHAFRPSTAPARKSSFAALVVTAIATSIDAMAVGLSLAMVGVPILPVALTIGAATMLMATVGTLAGQRIGTRFGRWAEVAGGLTLIALGAMICLEHFTA